MRYPIPGIILSVLALASCGGDDSSGPLYAVGVTVTGLSNVTGLTLQDNGKDNLTINSSGTATFATKIASQSAYAVSILTQPAGHTCFLTDASGTITDTTVNVDVVCPWHVAYVIYPHTVNDPNSVAAFYINESTGAWARSVAEPLATGNAPAVVEVTQSEKFCYVANGDGTVSAYSIDAATGALAPVPGSPFTVGSNPVAIAVSPSGQYIYIVNEGSANVSALAIDASTGALAPIPGSPFSTVLPYSEPNTIAIDLTNTYAFVSNGVDLTSNVSFRIDPISGALIYAQYADPYVAGAGPAHLIFAPSGDLYEVDIGGSVLVYTINFTFGDPILIDEYPSPTGISEANDIELDPSGKFLYIPDLGGSQIVGFTVDSATGALTPMTQAFAAMPKPRYITIDPSGKYAYVTALDGSANIFGFALDPSTGALAPIGSGPLIDATFGGAAIAIAALQ
jgi:6-phosphogluconolactonase